MNAVLGARPGAAQRPRSGVGVGAEVQVIAALLGRR